MTSSSARRTGCLRDFGLRVHAKKGTIRLRAGRRGLQRVLLSAAGLDGATPFRHLVSEEMKRLPFGTVVTYGDIAKRIAAKLGKSRMSAQAVGGAVGWNPICIIIPCHRVIGAGGKLTGYGGGMKNKIALLKHEGVGL